MAEKNLFQLYVESNSVGAKSKDLTEKKFDKFTVVEFVGHQNKYFIWKCQCSCGAIFERSSKAILSHPHGHCGSAKAHAKWHQPNATAEHFLSLFIQGHPDECWEWAGSRGANGYGRFGDDHKLAHRYSLEYFKGPIPKGMHACHTCDNPPCVNPNHLYAGSRSQNMRDKHSRGRHWPFALTKDDVLEIRKRMARGLKYGDIRDMAKEYGCDKSLLHLIKNNKIWPDVPWPDEFNGVVPKLKGGKLAVKREKK